MRIATLISVLALSLGLVACGGGKSATQSAQNAAGAAQGAASNVGNTAKNAAGSMENAAGSMASSAMQSMPNCGAVKPVWVNLNSKAYHEPGDPYYGKTKHGQYMCPSAAVKAGYHPAGGGSSSAMETKGHHHHGESGNMNAPMDQSTP